ncbi:hypothetical protein DFH01_20975 [Falsiroseomonas bella]|uniref:Lipoprotein n=1 Tax=Falsiroseomonas bella TaxID=2184016 RepID=A0A317F734_9PROT|nr:hypothetical protein [Falsiroseomonas bella]PWS34834.1 hypothetical protein DFH01_20975 [Falsiroseomonas bella]
MSIFRVLPALGLSLLCAACATEPVTFVAPPHEAAAAMATSAVAIVPGGQAVSGNRIRTGVWVLRQDGSVVYCSIQIDVGDHLTQTKCAAPVRP